MIPLSWEFSARLLTRAVEKQGFFVTSVIYTTMLWLLKMAFLGGCAIRAIALKDHSQS